MSKPRPVRPASAARAADRPRPAGARGQADACPAAERSLRPKRSSLPKSVPCCRRRRERERLEGLLKGLLSSRRSRKRQQQQRQQQRKGRKGHEAQAHPKRFVAIWQQEGSAITHTGQSVIIIKRGASNKNFTRHANANRFSSQCVKFAATTPTPTRHTKRRKHAYHCHCTSRQLGAIDVVHLWGSAGSDCRAARWRATSRQPQLANSAGFALDVSRRLFRHDRPRWWDHLRL